jgi:hypothetical protein
MMNLSGVARPTVSRYCGASEVEFGARYKVRGKSVDATESGAVAGGVVMVSPSIPAVILKSVGLGFLANTIMANPTLSGLGTTATGVAVNQALKGDSLKDPD